MIKVLQVLGGLNRGGAETMVVNLHHAIDRNQVQFDYIIHTNKPQDYINEVKSLGAQIYIFPAFTGKNIITIKRYWKNFFENHPEYKILHSHVRSYASIYLPIARRYGVTTIIHSHNTSNGSGLSALVKKIMQFPLRMQADFYFGCSYEAGKWLFGEKVVNSSRYYMLKNAVDTNKFKFNQDSRDAIRNEFEINEECLFIGTVGRLTSQKNPEGIIKICSILKQQSFNFKFIWVGNGELYEELKKTIHDNLLDDVVFLTGVRDDVYDILQGIDVFILPSLWEGLPVVAVEAQAAGLPCYLADTITKDINISKLVHYLPINEYRVWSEALMSIKKERLNVVDEIIENGFDIKSSAEWILNFYSNI